MNHPAHSGSNVLAVPAHRASRRSRIFGSVAAAAVASVLLLTGCATTGSDSPGSPIIDFDEPAPTPPAAAGEVLGQGTVLQKDGEDAHFCLGGVAESYPPQCSGPPVAPWDWSTAELSETAQAVTWGTYAVQGTWDGTTFAPTQPPIPLALYDPMPVEDPTADRGPGASSEDDLAVIQDELHNLLADADSDSAGVLSAWTDNGYLYISVVYDDGMLQDWLDTRYGPDVVVVQSALRSVAG